MKMRDTVNLWRNAIRILGDGRKRNQHALAQRVLDAIKREWIRRRPDPKNPDGEFAWPSTDASPGSRDLDTEDWVKDGVLHYMGYRVGNTEGEPQGIREKILSEIFRGPIPPAFERNYLNEWGEPSTVARLRKLAETMAALTRNAKRRRDARMIAAIRDWESDLNFLYHEYYAGKFHFAWPESSV
ncbi:hypothetical protein [Labrys sp. (in: a-proteobacteria)]|uniref:hypothetical protein n=1 Tax=Labrys sp. (in: a-proteobacteria) TaxID=1917972 RepID=UPI0039E4107E